MRWSIIILSLVFLASFAAADIQFINEQNPPYPENNTMLINFSVTYNITGAQPQHNITKVLLNGLLPDIFIYQTGTAGSSKTGAIFNTLADQYSWYADGLVMNESTEWFWFTIITPTVGNEIIQGFIITAHAENNTGTIFSKPYEFSVQDATAPTVTINTPTNGSTIYKPYVYMNISLNETGSCMYSTPTTTQNFSMTAQQQNTTFIKNATSTNGTKTIYFYCQDLFGNYNTTQFVIVNVDLNLSTNQTNSTNQTSVNTTNNSLITITFPNGTTVGLNTTTNTSQAVQQAASTSTTTGTGNPAGSSSQTGTSPTNEEGTTEPSTITKYVAISVVALIVIILILVFLWKWFKAKPEYLGQGIDGVRQSRFPFFPQSPQPPQRFVQRPIMRRYR